MSQFKPGDVYLLPDGTVLTITHDWTGQGGVLAYRLDFHLPYDPQPPLYRDTRQTLQRKLQEAIHLNPPERPYGDWEKGLERRLSKNPPNQAEVETRYAHSWTKLMLTMYARHGPKPPTEETIVDFAQ